MPPCYPVVAFSPSGWTVEADSEAELAGAHASDGLRDWQNVEVFDSAGRCFVAARVSLRWPQTRLGLWLCRVLGRVVRVEFDWARPRQVSIDELRQRLSACYPPDWFDGEIATHEELIRRLLNGQDSPLAQR
jgi:hypothetical protein